MIQEQIDTLIKAFETGKLDYDSLIEKGIHKYIRKESDGKGGWNYIYRDQEEHSKQEFTNDVELGHSGKFIKKTATNPAQVYKGISKWLNDTKKKWEPSFSRTTSSRYITTEDEGNTYKIRIANHSPAISDERQWKGVDVQSYGDGTVHVDIDSSFGYKTEDIKNIIEISKQTAKEIAGKEAKLTPEEVYSKNSISDTEDLSSKVLKDLFIEEDYYGVNKQFAESLIQDFKQTEKYKKYAEEKRKEDKIEKINNYTDSKGVFVNKNNSSNKKDWVATIPDKIMGDLWIEHVKDNNLSKDDKQKYKEEKEAFKNKLKIEAIEEASKDINKSIEVIKQAFESGLLDYDKIEKAHKYIKREGNKGNYKYFYNDNIEENGKTDTQGRIERLSQAEEQGSSLGGRRNVEATIFLRGNEGANSKDIKEQERKLATLFKDKGSFYSKTDPMFKDFLGNGVESKVYRLNDREVVKRLDPAVRHSDLNDFMDRIAIHNLLFPETKYELLGLSDVDEDSFSDINFVIKQNYIKDGISASTEDIETDMINRGYEKINDTTYRNKDYTISDLRDVNVFKSKNGNLYYIDPVITINKDENGKENREQLNRLSPEEERGRLLGGTRNAEATAYIIEREKESSGEDKEIQRRRRLEQISLLEEFAKKENIWHENLESYLGKDNYLDAGSENEVFEDKDPHFVAKINNLSVDKTPLDYLDRLSIHNTLFPNVYYEVIGFGKDNKGRFSFLTRQPFIKTEETTTKRDVDEYMAKLGFKPDGLYSYSNDKYVISDVHEGNVLKNGDNLYFIDTFISKNDLIQKAQTKDYGIGKHTEEVQVTNKKTGKTYYRKEIVGRKQEDEKKGKNKKSTDQPEKKYTTEELNEHAKNATLNDLQRTIKESPDPDLRMTAHNEIARREQEEHVQDQEKDQKETREDVDKNSKKLEKDNNEHVEKFRQLSDEQVKFYLDAPYPKVKEAAQIVADERGLSVVSKEDYIKQFEDRSNPKTKEEYDRYSKEYQDEGRESQKYLDDDVYIENDLDEYKGDMFKDIREYLSNIDEYSDKYPYEAEVLEGRVKNISKFICDNKIDKNICLNRRILTGNTFFTKLSEGDIYEDKSFCSSSLREIESFGDFNIKILAKKGSKVANVNNNGEQEYLIDKGSKFRVIEKRKDGLGITVELL